jgi:hypothetical protein
VFDFMILGYVHGDMLLQLEMKKRGQDRRPESVVAAQRSTTFRMNYIGVVCGVFFEGSVSV